MRHIIHIGPRQFRNESEIAYTHVLIGNRDKEHARPDIAPEKISTIGRRTEEQKLTPEEKQALHDFSRKEIEGYFDVKPLVWCVSAEEAEAKKELFQAPEWQRLSVVPVALTIPNA